MFTKAVGLTSLETAFASHLEPSVLVSQGFTRSHGPKDVLPGGEEGAGCVLPRVSEVPAGAFAAAPTRRVPCWIPRLSFPAGGPPRGMDLCAAPLPHQHL